MLDAACMQQKQAAAPAVRAAYLYAQRLVQVLPCQSLNLFWHCRTEQQGLMMLGQAEHDVIDLMLKSHIQHHNILIKNHI